MKDMPIIVFLDGESDVPMSSKHDRLSKNSNFVNNNEESDEDFTIRFKRSLNHKLPFIPKTLIDESMDDDVANSTDVKYQLSKNTTFVNNNEVHIVSSNDENILPMANNLEIVKETDNDECNEDFTIRFKRSDNHKLPSIPKTLIDESTDDDVANSTDVKDRL
nr:hypothetical protein [Tanacetum cinerariifolium]